MNRIISEMQGVMPGPLVICIGGLHGNENQGVDAFNRIVQGIKEHNIQIRGKIVGLTGNMRALKTNQRFIDYDLNRCWTQTFIDDVRRKDPDHYLSEDKELLELDRLINHYLTEQNYTETVLVDLHTTSSEKGNFIVVPEDEGSHSVINALHLPVVIDLDKYLEGTLLQYFHKKGYTSFAFEGGMIGSDNAIDLHTSGIWEVLDAAGSIDQHDHHDVDHYENKLRSFAAKLPKTVKAFYRHWVDEEDQFEMRPGYFNFKPVKKGERLARDRHGPIVAPRDGLIFMPLYQKAGNDGFFLVDEINPED